MSWAVVEAQTIRSRAQVALERIASAPDSDDLRLALARVVMLLEPWETEERRANAQR